MSEIMLKLSELILATEVEMQKGALSAAQRDDYLTQLSETVGLILSQGGVNERQIHGVMHNLRVPSNTDHSAIMNQLNGVLAEYLV